MPSLKTSLESSFTKSIYRLFKKKKWDLAIDNINEKLGDTKIDWDDQSIIYMYLTVAYAYFLKEDFARTKNHLNFFLLKEFPNNGAGTLFLAYLHLLENDKPAAINLYTKLLKNPPYFRKAKKILNFLKKSNHNNFANYRPRFFYQHNFSLNHSDFFIKLFLITFVLSWVVVLTFYSTNELRKELSQEKESEAQQSGELTPPLPPPFAGFYQDMEIAIKERKINDAIIIYNQALNHDPNLGIEERFNILKSFLPTPEFSDLDFVKNLKPLKDNPTFYQGVYLKFIAEYQFTRNNSDHFTLVQHRGYSLIIPSDARYSLGRKQKYQVIIRLNKVNPQQQVLGEKVRINFINTEKPLIKK